MGHRSDDNCGSAGCSLIEISELLDPYRAFLHFHTKIRSHFLQGLVGYGREDAVGKRRNILVALDRKEIGRTELVDELPCT